jgi:hypothetical protein
MNITGKYLKAWKVEKNANYTKVDLGDSRKNKEGTYDKFTWFGVMFVGDAHKLSIAEGDTVEVVSGQIYQEKYQDKWYTRVTVFDAVVTKNEKKEKKEEDFSFGSFEAIENEELLPF